eukprot:scaffold39819_cov18-Tisochrysis_lutea.AAC.3
MNKDCVRKQADKHVEGISYEDCGINARSVRLAHGNWMPLCRPAASCVLEALNDKQAQARAWGEASSIWAKGAVTSMGRLCLLLATATMDAAGLHLTGGTHSVAKHAVDGLK